MAIPTAGTTPATSYTPTETWNSTISLIGDSESLIGENSSGEVATLGRPIKELAQNAKWLYELSTHAIQSDGVLMPGTFEDFNSRIDEYTQKNIRYKLTLTLGENLTLNAAYDESFDFFNMFSLDEIDINLNSKIISCEAGFTLKTALFHFYHCNAPLIKLRNGTVQDATGNLGNLIFFEDCIGTMVCDALITTGTVATSHYAFKGSRGIVKNGTLSAGLNGIVVYDTGFVLSQDNSSAVTCNSYGLRAYNGGIIRKYDATQPTGTTANELASLGGSID